MTVSEQPALNTDRELWREREGDYYANSIHVTASGGIGMNVGGFVIVLPIDLWHAAAKKEIERAEPSRGAPEVSHMLGKYLNTMVSDLRIDGKGEYLRELFSRYESEAESGHVVLLEALRHAIRFLPHNLDEICRAGDCTRCKVLTEAEAAIQQAERT